MDATGLEPDTTSQRESVCVIQDKRLVQNERSLLQARLQAVYNQEVTSFIKKDQMGIAIQWNKLESTPKVVSDRLQNAETVHTIKKRVSWEDGGHTGKSSSDSYQARLHGIYSQDTASKETDFMKLAKEWNKSGSQDEGRDPIIQNCTIYVLGEG